MSSNHFADELISRVRSLGHPLCVGLDPYLDRIPPPFRCGSMAIGDPRTSDAVADFLGAVIDRLSGKVAVIKPQIALFEQLDWRGMRMLEGILDRARKQHLLVLLDAKRGDIGATAEGYAQAYLDPSSSMSVDAMTVNPYMGRDAIEPFVRWAEQARRGVFVLVRNSNPGSSDYQCLATGKGLLFEVVADSLREIEERLLAPQTKWSSLGITVAATYPDDSDRIRTILPRTLFLVLGYGAQGGTASEAVRGFVQGPNGMEGGLVNASRTVLFPADGMTDNIAQWEGAFDLAVDQAISALRQVV